MLPRPLPRAFAEERLGALADGGQADADASQCGLIMVPSALVCDHRVGESLDVRVDHDKMVTSQESEAPSDPEAGHDTNRDFMLRHAGG